MKENDSKSWTEYLFVMVIFAVIVAFLYFLFTLGLKDSSEKVVIQDTIVNKIIDSHEIRLDHIDTLHLKYVNEK